MPHLQELVKLHKDAPFALIGINFNDAPDKYRAGLETHKVTWISAYQGDDPVISTLYRVSGYPTYFLIDADGELVQTGHGSTAFDEPIARLLKELEARGEDDGNEEDDEGQ
jgi:thiol-disulfide isomerase/thioredoxin